MHKNARVNMRLRVIRWMARDMNTNEYEHAYDVRVNSVLVYMT